MLCHLLVLLRSPCLARVWIQTWFSKYKLLLTHPETCICDDWPQNCICLRCALWMTHSRPCHAVMTKGGWTRLAATWYCKSQSSLHAWRNHRWLMVTYKTSRFACRNEAGRQHKCHWVAVEKGQPWNLQGGTSWCSILDHQCGKNDVAHRALSKNWFIARSVHLSRCSHVPSSLLSVPWCTRATTHSLYFLLLALLVQ